MTTTPRLNLTYLAPAQAQKHVTVNEALARLDHVIHGHIVSRVLVVEPMMPSLGDGYILPENASGQAWGGKAENTLARFIDGIWQFITPDAGLSVWCQDEAALLVYTGGAWALVTGRADTFEQLGINGVADSDNRLTVKSDSTLLTHDDVTPGSGDARQIINKSASDKTASVVFQTNYSGRAEFGLNGDDSFTLKTSEDGASFGTSLAISAVQDRVDVNHPLYVQDEAVLTPSVIPAFVGRVSNANTLYTDGATLNLTSLLDSHNGFGLTPDNYTVPVSGIYMAQVGIVIRSVSTGVSLVKLRVFKNGSAGQAVRAVTTDMSITTVNDSTLLQLSAGDTLSVQSEINADGGTVKFYTSTRFTLYRVA